MRAFDRSAMWTMQKKPGIFSPSLGQTSTLVNANRTLDGAHDGKKWNMGSRPCAVFQYCGPAMADAVAARALIDGHRDDTQAIGA